LGVGRLLRSAYLLRFSQPAADRAVYQALAAQAVRAVVEVGIDPSGRTARLIEVASWHASVAPLKYTGIDLYDARPAALPRLTLKQAHATLRAAPARVQLVPGELHTALERVANELAGTDLLLISGHVDPESLAQAWVFVPRMLRADSLVFLEEGGGSPKHRWRRLTSGEIETLACQASRLRRQAA
jgi:hypothetical protein